MSSTVQLKKRYKAIVIYPNGNDCNIQAVAKAEARRILDLKPYESVEISELMFSSITNVIVALVEIPERRLNP